MAKPRDNCLKDLLHGGWGFENNGVETVLASPYFPGTIWQQINSPVRAVGCFATVDNVKNVLAIWPKRSSRGGSPVVISPENGMIGYPTFQLNMVKVRTLFDPSIQLTGTGSGIRHSSSTW